MDKDPTLKILKMVKEGFLTPEQGQRLIRELLEEQRASQAQANTPTEPTAEPAAAASPLGDVFSFFGQSVEKIVRDFQSGFDQASQTVKENLGLGPQILAVKTVSIATGAEKFGINIPLKIFVALKTILTAENPLIPQPIQGLDFKAIFQSLEAGATGKILEISHAERGERLEVWVI